MPELPDVVVYQEALERFVVGRPLVSASVPGVALVKTWDPPVEAAVDRRVEGIGRIGKRLVFHFEDDLHFVLHLMIAGRLRWRPVTAKLPRRVGLAVFRFADGALHLTEQGSHRLASLHVVQGRQGLTAHDPGGIDPLQATRAAFTRALCRENHTLKRALTDPRAFSGIGNAYSDEILHAARLSPLQWTSRLEEEEIARLHAATSDTLRTWIDRLRAAVGDGFPDKVTAFRPEMSVHGKYREPCPVCGDPVQRIRYAKNETNYCPGCQTDGQVYADRSLSRLLKGDWPRTVADWESFRRGGGAQDAPADG